MDPKDPEKDIPGAPALPGNRPWAKARPVAAVTPEFSEDDAVEEVQQDADDDERTYDPHRGDRVDILNDTTPEPPVQKPERHAEWPETKHKSKKSGLKVVVSLLLLFVAAGAVYWFVLKPKPVSAPAVKTTSQTQNSAKTSVSSYTEAALKQYNSDAFQLGLSYPGDWKVAETADKLTVTSPQTSLKDLTGESQKVYIQVTLQNLQTSLPEFAKGSATSVLESKKISYKNPTANQRAQTYISFTSYATSTANAFDAIYVTGDNGYTQGQEIPMADVVKANPLISVKFLSCTDQTCGGTPTAVSLASTDWTTQSLSKPVLDIFESLSID